ncbi:MAG TPA: response regulator transcription factor [Terriglobales bacterium]|nr:response regulator transcription factor [Terriglobales bacterium]
MIAAAQSSYREQLRRQLESEPRIEVIGEASDSLTAYSLTRRLRPDILVIECGLNREFSTYCARGRMSTCDSPTVIAIAGERRVQDIVEAFDLGARGVVVRAALPLVWKTAIRSILAGQCWIDDRSVRLLLDTVRGFLRRTQANSLPDCGLTLREMEIATGVAAGRSNKEVGQQFSICERTVKHHLTNIFRKVGVSSRLELAVFLRENASARPHLPERIQPRGDRDSESARRRNLFAIPDR